MQGILVIDDDGAIYTAAQIVLEREGYEVVCAADGAEGIRLFDRSLPQLIITDIIMPKQGRDRNN
jgi:CheY-like chemotaxis protein